ncbi:CDGSH iron-sulfur domain-containing protein [Nocardia iowensis]|uniref:CDGSH iron-sulfur domain-containing protein n=1 Tax=Nocardia iowensis TaxID=204891 RepID=A0ABX8RU04_NOCIO|nr:CDGSH iron-sulfur domain-containing protein [Nocardia iowensis]QXN93129.1 CDGSH iron-sulfur domain-containing protein [Nocardia iowensis]
MSSDDTPVIITAYQDGPLLVRGPFRLVDGDDQEIAVPRKTVALCRCGRSSQKPWCDSSHKLGRRSRKPSGPTESAKG